MNYLSDDFRGSITPFIESYEAHISRIDSEVNYDGREIVVNGPSGVLYKGLEYVKAKNINFLHIHKFEAKKASYLLISSYIERRFIQRLRGINECYVIYARPNTHAIFDTLVRFKDNFDMLSANMENVSKIESEIKDLKIQRREFERESQEYEAAMRSILVKEQEIEILKTRNRSFRERGNMASFLYEVGMSDITSILKNFDIELISKDFLILKLRSHVSQLYSSNNYLHSLFHKLVTYDSMAKSIESLESYLFSDNIGFTYIYPELDSELGVLNEVKEIPEISIERSLFIADQVAAPVKPHMIAALLASGTAGDTENDIMINDEPTLIKSVMLPFESSQRTYINGVSCEEKIIGWKPQLGVFNKLRKEITILRD